jgi:hypothetical protein
LYTTFETACWLEVGEHFSGIWFGLYGKLQLNLKENLFFVLLDLQSVKREGGIFTFLYESEA